MDEAQMMYDAKGSSAGEALRNSCSVYENEPLSAWTC